MSPSTLTPTLSRDREREQHEPSLGGETGWDCHAHLFGPYERYPLAAERSYTPPEAHAEHYRALLARLGLAHGVLVHPSAYGADHRLLLDTLDREPSWRGVIVMQPGEDPQVRTLRALRERGVRAARFSHRSSGNFAGSARFDDLQRLARPLAEAGLHAELWTDEAALPGIADALRALPVPVVLDHMGGFDVQAGIDAPGFRALLGLLETGRVWVKLCAYRNVAGGALGAARPFHDKLVEANPQQLLWGSDWPHLRVEPAPDAAALLALLRTWTPEAIQRQVLVSNPARLYG